MVDLKGASWSEHQPGVFCQGQWQVKVRYGAP